MVPFTTVEEEVVLVVWVSMIFVIRVESILSFSTYWRDQLALAGVFMVAMVGAAIGVESAVEATAVGTIPVEEREPVVAVMLEVEGTEPELPVEAGRLAAVVEDAGAAVLGGLESTWVVMVAFQTPQSAFLGSLRLVIVAEN